MSTRSETGEAAPALGARLIGARALALLLVALCLRGPFAGVGPLLDSLQSRLDLSTVAISALTALPVMCFAVFSLSAPVVAARWGIHGAVLIGMVLLGLGVSVRGLGTTGLFLGTAVLSAGIAIVNVLLPAVARAEYGGRSPVVVGWTTCGIAISSSLGAGIAQPAASALGSPLLALSLWIVPVAAATVAFSMLTRRRPVTRAVRRRRHSPLALFRDRVALSVIGYFSLQGLGFYTMLTWLPRMLQQEAGLSAGAAGGLLAAALAMGAPASLVIPRMAARRTDQRLWIVLVSLPNAMGLLGLLLAPTLAPVAWAVLYGLGTGASFPLAMTLLLLRTRNPDQTGRLSAAAQGLGYTLAALGPFCVGTLHGFSGSWRSSFILLASLLVVQTVCGLSAARPRLVAELSGAPPPRR